MGRTFAANALEWRLKGKVGTGNTAYQLISAHPVAVVLNALFELIDARGYEKGQIRSKRKRKRKR